MRIVTTLVVKEALSLPPSFFRASVEMYLWHESIISMQSIAEIVSPYRGSEKTYEMVKEQVRERWGDECAEEFDPHCDAMPYASWVAYGYQVRKGESALKSITYLDVKDEEGHIAQKVRRSVNLFHKCQVTKCA